MPKRSRISDLNQLAKSITDEATDQVPKPDDKRNPAAVELGRLGGKRGGPARAKKLTPEQRSEIARNAAKQRWAKRDR